eukprot:TRINITY_DN6678_c0_g1_i1.p1 TRINITY_DN6678_c0_g1~~TRINITY_DN6678_c0_g1_i1.p1  ORF type:complete len:547 (-),score=115.02 TRINITY_DN6678_c0_g1_i1:697-2337(-)
MAAIVKICSLFFILQVLCVHASIHRYDGKKFVKYNDVWIFQGGAEGMFKSSPNAVKHWTTIAKGLANGKSHVWFEVVLQRHRDWGESDGKVHNGKVQVLLFEVGDRGRIGYDETVQTKNGPTTQRRFCCTPALAEEAHCTPGEVIVHARQGDDEWPRTFDIPISGATTSTNKTEFPYDVKIIKTGMYYLWYVICDEATNDVTITGLTRWKNPYGYLPGMMMPLMGFYGLMALAYLAVGFTWLFQYARFWKDILQLQNCITVVIFLGMAEMATWYFDFVNFNATGFRPYGITLWAVTLGAVRKTLSRTLLLVVSMGYGVVRPTLGGLSTKVVILGVTYFIATEALDVVQNVGNIDDLNGSEKIFLVLPVAILDAVFILWIFTSLSKTLSQVQVRRQTAKLDLYRKFTNSLAVAVVVSVAWIGYEMYLKVFDRFNERWQSDWITLAFWHVLTFVMLCIICYLWAPSQNSTRYAYSEEVGEEFEDEEAVALTSAAGTGVAKTTTKSVDPEAPTTAAAKMGSKAKMDKKPSNVNTDVFSLDEEEEEGKLE